MKLKLKNMHNHLAMITLLILLGACNREGDDEHSAETDHHTPAAAYERGPHGGRMLKEGSFSLELAIFETGVPPEFRVWAYSSGKPLEPGEVKLQVRLTRLGNQIENIAFKPQDDYLRGDQVVYEPHSFAVTVEATFAGTSHRWDYDSFEGRTRIDEQIARAFELETEIAGPGKISQTIEVYGHVDPNPKLMSTVSARFDGVIQSISANQGDAVKAGQLLLTIESNDSLKPYQVKAPINGIITERKANTGESTAGRELLTIVDPSSVWVHLAIFPTDLHKVQIGATVKIYLPDGEHTAVGAIDRINMIAEANQAVLARVVMDNTAGHFFPGSKVRAEVQLAQYEVPLAVKRVGVQTYRDFNVVYVKVGDEFEVRMLELGQQDDEWVEVLGGLDAGTLYVTNSSYLIKADIEKSGATHDH